MKHILLFLSICTFMISCDPASSEKEPVILSGENIFSRYGVLYSAGFGGSPGDVYSTGDYTIVVDREKGIQIIRLSGDKAVLLKTIELPGLPLTTKWEGQRLYSACGYSGLTVYDLSTPANPALLKHIKPGYAVYDVSIDNSIIYIAAGDRGIKRFDKGTFENKPDIPGTGFAYKITAAGGYLYCLDRLRGIVCFDTALLSEKAVIPELKTGCYLNAALNTLLISDSNRVNIVPLVTGIPDIGGLQTVTIPGLAGKTIISGSTLYAAAGEGGISLIELETGTVSGRIECGGSAEGIAFYNGTMLIANSVEGLQVCSNKTTKSWKFGGTGTDIYISDTTCFVSSGEKGLQVLDISGGQVRDVSVLANTENVVCVTGDGNDLYMGTSTSIYAIDLTDRENPRIKKRILTGESIAGIAVRNGYLYISRSTGGIAVYNITGNNPVLCIELDRLVYCGGLTIKQNRLWAVDKGSSLIEYDLTDPGKPGNKKRIPIKDIKDVTFWGNYIFAACGKTGLCILDREGKLLQVIPTGGFARAVNMKENQAYVADAAFGLVVIGNIF